MRFNHISHLHNENLFEKLELSATPERIVGWTNVTALPEPQRTIAVKAFDALASDQRGLPERMGGGDIENAAIHHSGIYAYLTEHVGDLTHRMCKAMHVTRMDCGADYIRNKGGDALRRLGSGHGFAGEVVRQLQRNYAYRKEQGRAVESLGDYVEEFTEAGRRYADAHAALVVFNEAQWHGREAAVSIGRRDYVRAVSHLKVLVGKASDAPAFGAWASLAQIGADGRPKPYQPAAPVNEAIDPAEGPGRYWYVLEKDGLARCVNEHDDDLHTLWGKGGWEIKWDSARSPEEGLKRALDDWGLLPWDKYDPLPIVTPTVLYRSVSIAEMRDILKTGALVGKASGFNEFEHRRWVFFGDKLSSNLIWQGEDHERGVLNALSAHPLHAKFAEVQARLDGAYRMLADGAREDARRHNEQKARWRKQGHEVGADEEFTDQDYAAVQRGNRDAVIRARQLGADSPGMDGLMAEIRALEQSKSKLRDKFREIKNKTWSSQSTKINSGLYSSVIIETKPITGGLHYSNVHGQSKFGTEKEGELDEYTFPPGRVTLADIARLHWVKDKQIVATSTIEAAPEILRRLNTKAAA